MVYWSKKVQFRKSIYSRTGSQLAKYEHLLFEKFKINFMVVLYHVNSIAAQNLRDIFFFCIP